jgi:hypothetical protein
VPSLGEGRGVTTRGDSRGGRRSMDVGDHVGKGIGLVQWATVGRPARNSMIFYLFKNIQTGLN